MGTLLGNALAKAGLVSQKEADRIERELQMRKATEKANQPTLPQKQDLEKKEKG